MSIQFNVKFNSVEGQDLYISGSCKELGNFDKAKAVPMKFAENGTWTTEIDIKTQEFSYLYFIKDKRDHSITEEWAKRNYKTPSVRKNIILQDEWLYPSLPEFNLNTTFFNHISPEITPKKSRRYKKNSHRFLIPFKVLNDNEAMFILGNCDRLGNWKEDQAVPMLWDGKKSWYVDVDLSKVEDIVEYKYLIKDTKTGSVKYYETENNRFSIIADKEAFIVNHDTAFRQPQHEKWRGSGIAVPVFSLRSPKGLGVGEFLDLIEFGKWTKAAGFSMIQILPIHDTTTNFDCRDSYPYSAISVYALHPMYLRLSDLTYGLTKTEKSKISKQADELNKSEGVDYSYVNKFKIDFLQSYYKRNVKKILSDKKLKDFLKENENWIKSYAAFSVLRDKNKTANFYQWKSYSSNPKRAVTAFFKSKSKDYTQVMFYVFMQWQLHLQLSHTVKELHELGITLKGDLPIGIYPHSADAWSHPDLFHMDQQAGAPPDDFAVLGQNWEFPTYDWERMKEDDFAWWKSRFQFMSRYFDAFRIDHILGFFRIWQIPKSAVQGILGRFEPALPVLREELDARGIHLPDERLYEPYLHYDLIQMYFADETESVVEEYFDFRNEFGELKFKEKYDSQRKISEILGDEHIHAERLMELHANVLFIREEGEELRLHPRFGINNTHNYKWLDKDVQDKLYALYLDYFFNRQENFWREKGLEKLPALKKATDMLTCGEDLGMVPKVVPQVMADLAILSLKVQRMPAEESLRFSHPGDAPYLSVVSPSSHDTSTLRQWWKENPGNTQYFFNHLMGHIGEAPTELTPLLLEHIIDQHLYSPAMLSVIPLQEFLGMDADLRNPDEDIERVNIPAVFPHCWSYRMHLTIEELQDKKAFTKKLKAKHQDAGRID